MTPERTYSPSARRPKLILSSHRILLRGEVSGNYDGNTTHCIIQTEKVQLPKNIKRKQFNKRAEACSQSG